MANPQSPGELLPTKATRLPLPPTLNLERAEGRVVFRPEVGAETAGAWLRDILGWFGEEQLPLSDWAHKRDLALAPPDAWDAGRLVAKRCLPKPHRALATGLGLARSRAERAFEHALRFEQCGLATPRAMAWMEVRARNMPTTFFLIAEHVTVGRVWDGCADPHGKSMSLAALARAIRVLHHNGLRHRDLKISNLYVEDGRAGFYDLESVRPMTPPLPRRIIVRDLGRLAASFLSEAAREAGITPEDWREFIVTYTERSEESSLICADLLGDETWRWAERKARRNARVKRPLA